MAPSSSTSIHWKSSSGKYTRLEGIKHIFVRFPQVLSIFFENIFSELMLKMVVPLMLIRKSHKANDSCVDICWECQLTICPCSAAHPIISCILALVKILGMLNEVKKCAESLILTNVFTIARCVCDAYCSAKSCVHYT